MSIALFLLVRIPYIASMISLFMAGEIGHPFVADDLVQFIINFLLNR